METPDGILDGILGVGAFRAATALSQIPLQVLRNGRSLIFCA
jgi:hypothetical protein